MLARRHNDDGYEVTLDTQVADVLFTDDGYDVTLDMQAADVLFTDDGYEVTLGIQAADLNQVDTSDVSVNGLLIHNLSLSSPYQSVLLAVYPRSNEHRVNVYISYNENPRISTHDYQTQVRRVPAPTTTKYRYAGY